MKRSKSPKVQAFQGPGVPRSQSPKDQDISNSHSNTSLTLKKVHLVWFSLWDNLNAHFETNLSTFGQKQIHLWVFALTLTLLPQLCEFVLVCPGSGAYQVCGTLLRPAPGTEVLYHSDTHTALTQTSFAQSMLMCQLCYKDINISVLFSLEENPQILVDPPQNTHFCPLIMNLWPFTHILTPVRSFLDDFLPLNFD